MRRGAGEPPGCSSLCHPGFNPATRQTPIDGRPRRLSVRKRLTSATSRSSRRPCLPATPIVTMKIDTTLLLIRRQRVRQALDVALVSWLASMALIAAIAACILWVQP